VQNVDCRNIVTKISHFGLAGELPVRLGPLSEMVADRQAMLLQAGDNRVEPDRLGPVHRSAGIV
jgi:hypothetical protein